MLRFVSVDMPNSLSPNKVRLRISYVGLQASVFRVSGLGTHVAVDILDADLPLPLPVSAHEIRQRESAQNRVWFGG